jgi:hypothetical protein
VVANMYKSCRLVPESSPGFGLRDLGWQHMRSLKRDPSKNINTQVVRNKVSYCVYARGWVDLGPG